MLLLVLVCVTAAQHMADDNCDAAPKLTMVLEAQADQRWRHRELVPCQVSLDEVTARIPASVFASATLDEAGQLEDAPLFHDDRPHHQGDCFRAVRDDFITDEVGAALLSLLDEHFEKERTALRNKSEDASEVLLPNVAALLNGKQKELLDAVAAKVRTTLQTEFFTPALSNPFIVARSSLKENGDIEGAELESAERRREFSDGRLKLGRLRASDAAVLPHVDAAYLPKVAYSALVYLGEPVVGGETLILDSLNEEGVISAGLLCAPQRGRVLLYSAGPENVHTGAGNLRGRRTLLQFWWQLEESAPA